jgi:protein-glutamine gamma-glutamyltransferase
VSAAAPAAPAALPGLIWTCAAFTGGVLLHVDRLPLWASGAALVIVAWRLTTARRGGWYPGVIARALLALALVALVLARYHTLNGLAAGTTLLLLMAALKLLETRSARDEGVMLGVALFLLLAACLDREALVRAPLYAGEAWLCCAALAVIAAPGLGGAAALKLAGRALLLSLPLAVALFLFFPRLAGAFWAIPQGEQAVTGLSDSMSPGSILALIASYEPAFRVKFTGALPPPAERYWRGPVLHDFDGQTWRAGALFRTREPLTYLGTAYRYEVALEPSHRRWWLALDTPLASPDAHVLLTYDYQLLAEERVNQPVTYEVVSYTHTGTSLPLDPAARREDTALPPGANPRTRALAQSLRARAADDADFVHAVLEHLAHGGFVYSLTPERLGANAVDEFLFDTREGFCGHYASAFVTLMRGAGVPARVVTGYLGGEWNPIGRYLVVRQADAHAWAEVWIAGRGWTRIDPTAVVEPERLRRGLLDLMPGALSTSEWLLHRSPWLTQLLQRWDAANNWWSERVVKFDYAAQLELLGRLGIRAPDASYLGWAFMLALCGWLAIIAWHIGRQTRRGAPDPLARAYLSLCRKLARAGAAREAHQGPLSFAAAVSARRPDLHQPVHSLLAHYAQLRYGRPAPASRARDIGEFRRAVARLHVRRTAPR